MAKYGNLLAFGRKRRKFIYFIAVFLKIGLWTTSSKLSWVLIKNKLLTHNIVVIIEW